MTVKELIKQLMKQPMNATVVVASDAEHSDYQLLESVQFGYWDQYDGYGEFHEEAAATDPEFEWEPKDSSIVAICFTPEG